jgi:hypothetical protein
VRASQPKRPELGTYAVRPPFLLEKIGLKCLGRERPEASSPRGQPAEWLLTPFNQVVYRKNCPGNYSFYKSTLKRKDLVALFRKKPVIMFDYHAQRRP